MGRTILISVFCTIFLIAATDSSGQTAYESPYRFIENKGQLPPSVHYQADIPGGAIYMMKDRIFYDLIDKHAIHEMKTGEKPLKSSSQHLLASRSSTALPSEMIAGHRFSARFIDAEPDVRITASGKTREYYNYFVGRDQSRWADHVGAYYIVNYEDLYPGINVSYYAHAAGLKYDFLVKPGGCPEAIRIDYTGAEVNLDQEGNLIITTSLGEIAELAPVAYQMNGQHQVEVKVNYRLEGFELGFTFPEGYDTTLPLVIDPILIFSTYSGSPADNWGNTATFDDFGNLYSGGITNHYRPSKEFVGADHIFMGEFPSTEGAYQSTWGGLWDVAVLKYDSTGTDLLYATYLGGSGSETPHSMIVNNQDELVIFGTTGSPDFPVTAQAYDKHFNGGTSQYVTITYENGTDFFVAKLSADGSELLSSTYAGGSQNDGISATNSPLVYNYGDQLRGDVIVDDNDNIYITSVASSPDLFEGVDSVNVFNYYGGGSSDGVMIKFDPDLNFILWGGFLGGSGVDASHSIKLDQFNNVFLAGGTTSADFPAINGTDTVFNGNVDGWIAVVQLDGSRIVRSTYMGTTSYDQIYFIDLDSEENVFAFGQTRGPVPIIGSVFQREGSGQFIQKYSKGLDSLLLSTTIGNTLAIPNISPTAFLVNECNNIYISGWGSTILQGGNLDPRGMPISEGAFQETSNGSDFYLAVFSDNMERFLYGSYFGGGEAAVHVDGGTSRFDKAGIVYHAVCADCGYGAPSQFTTTENAWSRQNLSVNSQMTGCNNAAFKFDLASLRAEIQTNSVTMDQPGIKEGCYPFTVVFENLSVGGEVYDWDFGDGTSLSTSSLDSIVHTYENPGDYDIILRVFDQNTCVEEDFDFAAITVFDYEFDTGDGGTICYGTDFQLSASGGVRYNWLPERGLSASDIPNPVASPVDTTDYMVTITDQNNCQYIDTIRVNVVPQVLASFEAVKRYVCGDKPELELTFTGLAEEINWLLGDGQVSGDSTFMYAYAEPGEYTVSLEAKREFCLDQQEVTVEVEELIIPNVFTPNADGINDRFEVGAPQPLGLRVYDRWGTQLYENQNYANEWDGRDLSSGVYFYELTFPDQTICTGWVQIMK